MCNELRAHVMRLVREAVTIIAQASLPSSYHTKLVPPEFILFRLKDLEFWWPVRRVGCWEL
uniref:Uncharacterized protein n=1 Tax=Anguilla anguilla TaxID=7936 RepID=A0A0E9V8V0_ANGAN